MLKLLLKPDQNSYQVKEDKTVVSTQLDGGASRVRRDLLNAAMEVECQFTLSPYEYQYFRAFYNQVNKGSDPFLIDLLVDSHELVEYVAIFKPGSWRLSKVRGLSFEVKIQLEVIPEDEGNNYANIVANFEPEEYVAPPAPVTFGNTEE
jgi:hypothetical protein